MMKYVCTTLEKRLNSLYKAMRQKHLRKQMLFLYGVQI